MDTTNTTAGSGRHIDQIHTARSVYVRFGSDRSAIVACEFLAAWSEVPFVTNAIEWSDGRVEGSDFLPQPIRQLELGCLHDIHGYDGATTVHFYCDTTEGDQEATFVELVTFMGGRHLGS